MNFVKTTVLLATLTGILVAIGGLIGGVGGAIIFLVIAGAMNFFAYWFSDKFALKMAGARQIEERDDPRLFAMVREVAEKSRMPMPRVYIIENPSPNAFATAEPGASQPGTPTALSQLFTVAKADAQSVNPTAIGNTSFDPGASPFGLYTTWPGFGNRNIYSEDEEESHYAMGMYTGFTAE